MENRTFRVLYLDAVLQHPPVLPGVSWELIPGSRSLGGYECSLETCDEIRRLTTEAQIDLIIIGNNLDAGVQKAFAVAEAMRSKTIIVWNDYRSGMERPYVRLGGFTRFCSRIDLKGVVRELLGL